MDKRTMMNIPTRPDSSPLVIKKPFKTQPVLTCPSITYNLKLSKAEVGNNIQDRAADSSSRKDATMMLLDISMSDSNFVIHSSNEQRLCNIGNI